MRDIAVTGVAGAVSAPGDGRNDAELLRPVVDRALHASGVSRADIDIVVSAGSEFLNGVVGTVMGAFDALPGWPPRTHTHLEADGAFALHEAWIRLLAGEGEAALVCAYSRPLADDLDRALALQLDPYLVAPLGLGPREAAALQARVLLDQGRSTERAMAEVAAERRQAATNHATSNHAASDATLPPDDTRPTDPSNARPTDPSDTRPTDPSDTRPTDPSNARPTDPSDALSLDYLASPLRAADCSTPCAGAAAMVLTTAALAERSSARPAWVAGIDQRIETAALGARDLATSPSTAAAAHRLGLPGTSIDVLELHARYSHQEAILLDAIDAAHVGSLNPSGGALPADPVMVTGLLRAVAAAEAVRSGRARRAVAHATNGPCLQHNLLCVFEARP